MAATLRDNYRITDPDALIEGVISLVATSERDAGDGKTLVRIEHIIKVEDSSYEITDVPDGQYDVSPRLSANGLAQAGDAFKIVVTAGTWSIRELREMYQGPPDPDPDLFLTTAAAATTYASIDDPRFEEATGLDEAAVAASISNPETTVNAAVLSVAGALVPPNTLSTVVIGEDLTVARPVGSSVVQWITTRPSPEQPLHIGNGDFVERVAETLIAWSPLNLNPFLWVDANQIAASPDAAVPQWNDLSGNGHHLKQATVANQPLFRATGFNGRPCLEFDGTDYMITDLFTPSIGEAWTVYLAAQSTPAATTGSDFIVGGSNNAGTTHQRLDIYRTSANVLTITRGSAMAGPALDNNPHHIKAVFNGNTPNSSAQIDAGAPTNGTTNLSGVEVARIIAGGRGDLVAANFFIGKLAGGCWIKGTVPTEEDSNMATWMQANHGVA